MYICIHIHLTYRDRLDTAIFAVNSTEKAASTRCSLLPRCESLK